jgi:hypothetical protein
LVKVKVTPRHASAGTERRWKYSSYQSSTKRKLVERFTPRLLNTYDRTDILP